MKRLMLVLLTSLLAAPFSALAQTPELGTLFFTPAERDMMNRARRGDPTVGASRRGESIVNGFVKRSDGQGTIWIDGREIDVKSHKVTGSLQPGIVGSLNDSIDIRVHNESQESGKSLATKGLTRRRDSRTPPVSQKSQ